jgi:hypothetical protein
MFIRPTPDGRSKDRLGIMKTTFNLKVISQSTSKSTNLMNFSFVSRASLKSSQLSTLISH